MENLKKYFPDKYVTDVLKYNKELIIPDDFQQDMDQLGITDVDIFFFVQRLLQLWAIAENLDPIGSRQFMNPLIEWQESLNKLRSGEKLNSAIFVIKGNTFKIDNPVLLDAIKQALFESEIHTGSEISKGKPGDGHKKTDHIKYKMCKSVLSWLDETSLKIGQKQVLVSYLMQRAGVLEKTIRLNLKDRGTKDRMRQQIINLLPVL